MTTLYNLLLCAAVAILFAACTPADYDKLKAAHQAHETKHQKMDETIDRFKKAYATNTAASVMALYADDVVMISPDDMAPMKGKKAYQETMEGYYKSFPDMKEEIVSIHYLEASNTVALELRITGTNTGPMMGMDGKMLKPTGKKLDFRMASFAKLNDQGLIVEERNYMDNSHINKQLGLK